MDITQMQILSDTGVVAIDKIDPVMWGQLIKLSCKI